MKEKIKGDNGIKLTVICPVYNQEELIIKALNSIPDRNDIETIVINDHSTDNTWNVLKEYLYRTTKKIVLLYNDINKGVGLTLNRGYDVAAGEYVVLLGSDDYFIDLEKILPKLDGTDLIYFNLEVNNGDIWRVNKETKNVFCGSVKCMRREFIGKTRCPDKRCGEDYDFYQELLKKNPTEKFTDITLKHYNWPREGSLINTGGKNEINSNLSTSS